MHLPLTFASFALLTASIVLLRIFFWRRFSFKTYRLAIILACTVIFLSALSFATKWTIYPVPLNAGLYWSSIASYEFFLMLFTLLNPKWLTSIIAAILIAPLLSASIFLPLDRLFDTTPHQTLSLGGKFVSVRTPWGTGITDSTGADLEIYRRPSWAFFLQRKVQAFRYYNTQCDTGASFAVLQPDHKSALMVCPAASNQPADAARSVVVKFH
jgi:hypothetical protein